MKLLSWLFVFAMTCTLQMVHAETATAVDHESDAIVLGKVIQPNSTNPSSGAQQNNPTQVPPVTVTNDMQEGDIQRQLPTLNEPVIDQANILSPQVKSELDTIIRGLYNEGKAQIGIVIVPTTGQEGIFDFAMRTAQTWGLGSAQQDNGLLIAVAINDRRLHIATGYGLEGVIPDIVASRIIREQITPYFKVNQFGQGLIAGVREIERIVNLDPEIAQQAAEELKLRQEQALKAQYAKEKTFNTVLFILIAGVIGSFIIGNRLSASVAGVTAFAASMIYGSGIIISLIVGIGIFFLLFTSIAQLIFQAFLSGGGRGGSGGRGGFGGGGFSGGGGGFGGGGASGSW
nr:TPM domain-containing protein [Acinetobacter sp. Ver3]